MDLTETRRLVSEIQRQQKRTSKQLEALNQLAAAYCDTCKRLGQQVEQEFPGVHAALDDASWPWDVGRLDPLLIEGDYRPGLHVYGPDYSWVAPDKFYYDPYSRPVGEADRPEKSVSETAYTPQQLIDRCVDLEQLSGVPISLVGIEKEPPCAGKK